MFIISSILSVFNILGKKSMNLNKKLLMKTHFNNGLKLLQNMFVVDEFSLSIEYFMQLIRSKHFFFICLTR